MKWLPHLALLGLAAAMVVVARVRHVTMDEAVRVAFDETASTDDRLWAMHVAACRASDVDPRLGVGLAEAFLQSGDERLAEAAILIDLCRHAKKEPGAPVNAAPPLQERYAFAPLPAGGWTPHRYRSLMLHRCKVGGIRYGGNRRMDLVEAGWFIDTLTGVDLPPDEILRWRLAERGVIPGAPR
ncbi:MAG: hypothetical protein AAF726_08300 [Planctomycetota bacterium]